MTEILEFSRPVFSGGNLNVTVRQGPKWAFKNLLAGQPITLQETDNPAVRLEAVYNGCLLVSAQQLEAMPAILQLEHDPSCREYAGLAKELQRVYGEEVRPYDLLTVVIFTPLFGAG